MIRSACCWLSSSSGCWFEIGVATLTINRRIVDRERQRPKEGAMRLVILGLPPSANNLYAVVGRRQVLSAEGRRFHSAFRAVAAAGRTALPTGGPFAMAVTYHLRYDRDVEGSHKAILDALSGTLWRDDRQLVLLTLAKRRLPLGVLPYVSVVLRPLARKPRFAPPSSPPGAAWRFASSILPPSTNNLYAVFGRARRLTREGRAAKDAYRYGFLSLGRRSPERGELRLRLRYGFVADRRDVDGSHKAILDAARGLLWIDDQQIVRLSLSKARVEAGAEALITLDGWTVSP
jgi:Holliday junction resolvase RusA-like endonuclease